MQKKEAEVSVYQRTFSDFGDEPRRILKIIQCFDKHCICHYQYIMVDVFDTCIGQAVGGKMDLIAGAAI